MRWLSTFLLGLAGLGAWGAVLFVCVYIIATVTLAPPFLLTVAAGAVYGVWKGSLIVVIGATLGASAAYCLALRLSGTRLVAWLHRHPKVAAARDAVRYDGAWVQFLLRLSPVVPFSLLNYTLGLARVRYRDFAIALVGMIPAIVLYAYYGRVIGDVTLIAAGVVPPRGPGYYAVVGVGLLATIAATSLITRAARRAIEQQRLRPGSTSPDHPVP
jgi:uncharacterized membrane protein YdjX (TVP38/TMEM64 family)